MHAKFTAQKLNGGEHQKSRWVLQMLSGSKSCACNRTSWFVDYVRRVGSALSGKLRLFFSGCVWMLHTAIPVFFKECPIHLTCLVLFDNLWKSRLLSGAPEVLLLNSENNSYRHRNQVTFDIYFLPVKDYSLFIIHIISAWWWIRLQHTITCTGLFFQYVQWTP